jgi:probable rRNA maturation factor
MRERVPEVVVLNRQRTSTVNLQGLQEFADRALRLCLRAPAGRENWLGEFPQLQIVLISDRRMSELHRRFLQITGPTDVITFQHGEIFISVETAHRQARRFRTSPRREIQLYLVHGLLHLQGYDDRTSTTAGRMKAMQKRILRAASN